MFKRMFLIAISVIFAISFASCSSAGDIIFGSGDSEEEIVYEYKDEAYIPIEMLRTLNPVMSMDEDTYFISKLIYDSLFVLDENLAPVKSLVNSYSYDKDNASLTINLKSGIMWHDGNSLTAADVKFTIDSITSLSYSGNTIYGEYVAPISSVRLNKDDSMKCIIYFNNADNMSLENLIFPIIPEHQYKSFSAMKSDLKGFIPVGTGEYKVKEYNSLSHLTLSANENYYGAVPQNEIQFVILPEKNDAINLIDVNNISILFEESMDRNTLIAEDPNAITQSYPANEAEFIGFNMRREALSDRRVRQAVAYAIDSDKILETAYFKSGVLSDSLYYPGYLGSKNTGDLYPCDLEKAAKLLETSQYKDLDGDGYLEDKNGEPLVISILVNSENQSRVTAAQMIKTNFDKLKFQSIIEYADMSSYNSRLASADFDIYIGGYKFNERYILNNLFTTGYNLPGYTNAKVDKCILELQSGISNEKKLAVYEEMKEILSVDIPYYCMFNKTYGALISPALEGTIEPMFNDVYRGCGDWKSKYEVDESDSGK